MPKGVYLRTEKNTTRYWLGKKRTGFIPWCKGTKGLVKAWNKGKKYSLDLSPEFLKQRGVKISIAKKAKLFKHSEETKIKIGSSRKGTSAWNKGLKGYRAGIKRENYPTGENHWSWKGGTSRDKHSIREPRYKAWRNEVFKRDNWTCRIADVKCNGQLQAHHILRWADYPELRYEINNGIALCQAHHPTKKAEEKRLIPTFQELVTVSKK